MLYYVFNHTQKEKTMKTLKQMKELFTAGGNQYKPVTNKIEAKLLQLTEEDNMILLDVDNKSKERILEIKEKLKAEGVAALYYTTFSSKEDNIKARFIIQVDKITSVSLREATEEYLESLFGLGIRERFTIKKELPIFHPCNGADVELLEGSVLSLPEICTYEQPYTAFEASLDLPLIEMTFKEFKELAEELRSENKHDVGHKLGIIHSRYSFSNKEIKKVLSPFEFLSFRKARLQAMVEYEASIIAKNMFVNIQIRCNRVNIKYRDFAEQMIVQDGTRHYVYNPLAGDWILKTSGDAPFDVLAKYMNPNAVGLNSKSAKKLAQLMVDLGNQPFVTYNLDKEAKQRLQMRIEDAAAQNKAISPTELEALKQQLGNAVPTSQAKLKAHYWSTCDYKEFKVPNASLSCHVFNPVTRVMEIPLHERKIAAPVRSELIDTWLRSMVSPVDYYKLMMWLADVSDPNVNLSTLYLTGASRAGKSFVMGLIESVFKGTRAPLVTTITEGFNALLLDSPLLVADEGLSMTGKSKQKKVDLLENLKKSVTDSNQVVTKKGIDPTKLKFRMRTAIATNSEPLSFPSYVGPNSRTAFLDRSLCIEVLKEGTKFVTGSLEGAAAGGNNISRLNEMLYEAGFDEAEELTEGDTALSHMKWIESVYKESNPRKRREIHGGNNNGMTGDTSGILGRAMDAAGDGAEHRILEEVHYIMKNWKKSPNLDRIAREGEDYVLSFKKRTGDNAVIFINERGFKEAYLINKKEKFQTPSRRVTEILKKISDSGKPAGNGYINKKVYALSEEKVLQRMKALGIEPEANEDLT